MNINIDSAIFIGFLAVNLVVGLKYGTRLRTIRDFALGGRNFNTSSIVATLVATWISGSFLFVSLAKIYSEGITLIVAYLFCASIFLTMGYIFIPRMREFLGNLSIAGSMGSIYGKEVEVITAVTGAISCLGMVAVQFKIFGTALNFFFDLDDTLAVIIGSIIVILYSSFGGIRSVTITDIVQFITFSVFIPIILFLLIKVVDLNHIYNTVQYTHFADFKKLFDYTHPNFFNFITLLFYFSFPNFPPEIFQRVLIAKNIKQVQKSFYLAFIICLAIISATIFMAILLFYINPNLEPNKIFHYIVDNYLYSGIKGLTVVGLIAMIMSTADSNINSSAILLTDFFRSFKITSPEFELIIARAFSVVLGVIAIILALSKTDLLSIILSTASFYMPIVNIPLMLAILGFRSTKKAVLIGMGASFITVISSYFIDISIDIIIPAMAVNFIFFIGSHYLLRQEGGWIGVKDKSPLEEIRRARKKKIDNIFRSIQEFNFIKFCKTNSPKDDSTYSFFGIFCFISTSATIYSTHNYSMKQHYDMLLYIYQSMLVISTCFMFYPIWSPKLKVPSIVGIVWNFALMYMLTFCSTFFVLLSEFGKLQLIVFTLNMVVIFIITKWQIAVSMIILGITSSIQLYKHYMGLEYLSLTLGSGYFNIIYVLLLVSTVLVAFLKPRQEYQELTEEKNEHLSGRLSQKDQEVQEALAIKAEFLRNIPHEYHAAMIGVVSTSETLRDAYDKLSDKHRKMAIDNIFTSSISLKSFDDNITTLARLSKPDYELNKEDIDFSALVHDRIQMCRKYYEENTEDREFILNIKDYIIVNADKGYMIHLLDNLIINAIKYCKKGKINITLSNSKESVDFVIADEGIGIPKTELFDIFEPFTVSSKTRTPAGGRGIGLAVCKRIAQAHGGSITADSKEEIGAAFTVKLPL